VLQFVWPTKFWYVPVLHTSQTATEFWNWPVGQFKHVVDPGVANLPSAQGSQV